MRRVKLACLAVILAMTGCTLSFQPLFTSNDVKISDPALLGLWHSKTADHDNTFTVTEFGKKRYLIRTTLSDQPGTPGEFVAEVGMIGKHKFLQMVPKRPQNIPEKSFYGGHFIQAFSFWKIEADADHLKLTSLSYRWLEAMLKAKKLEVKHENREGGFIVLTASSEELKALCLKYADDENAFSDAFKFERKK